MDRIYFHISWLVHFGSGKLKLDKQQKYVIRCRKQSFLIQSECNKAEFDIKASFHKLSIKCQNCASFFLFKFISRVNKK